MHVALIIDEERLDQEQAMLNRLCIGLMAEGVQVTRVVPDHALPDSVGKGEKRIALAPRLETPMRVLPWLRGTRVSRLAEKMERSLPDVLYAVGTDAWRVGIDLAEYIERPIVLDVFKTEQVRAAPRPGRHSMLAGYIACTGAISRMLAQRFDPSLVIVAPFGVAVPTTSVAPAPPAQPQAIAIIGRCRNPSAYRTVFTALDHVIGKQANVQGFLELRGTHEHEVWREAQRMDLLSWVSTVSDASSYRTLLARCDLLILPEASGEVRSVVLEAMAQCVPIIAREDPALDMMINNQTAMLISSDDADEWQRPLQRVLEDRTLARQLGENARRLAAGHHRSSDQVARLVQGLERVLTGGSYRFEPAKSS